METYHKINAPFKRYPDGKLMVGDWSVPEFGYLADLEWEFTEKVDGTNIRIGWNAYTGRVEFGGRSDNAMIPKYLLEVLKSTFTPERFLAAGLIGQYTLFGEGYGPKIQGGGKYSSAHKFVLFDVTCDTMKVCQEHNEMLSVIQTVSTLLKDSVSPVTTATSKSETPNGLSESERKQPNIGAGQSKRNTTSGRTEIGTYSPNSESLRETTTECSASKMEFAQSVKSQKPDSLETEKNSYLSPLTTVTSQERSEDYFAKPAISVYTRQNRTESGSEVLNCTCTVNETWWLRRESVSDVAKSLDVDAVPVLGNGTLFDGINLVKSGLTSQWGNFEAEGLVAVPKVPLFNRKGERIITKIKAKDFR